MSGHDLKRSTGMSFLFRITVGAVVSLGVGRLWTLSQPAASRAAEARRVHAHHDRGAAFTDQVRDTRLEHQELADTYRPRPLG
jgi:hypothetical protein